MKKVVQKYGAVQFGGNANNGVQAGSFYANANNAPSNANANIGSHLSLFQEFMVFADLAPWRKKTRVSQSALVAKVKTSFQKSKLMKRVNNLYTRIISIENLILADERARKGKRKSYGVKKHDAHREENIKRLHEILKNKTFRNSEYETFFITEPKRRQIFRLPYFPDRIVHHAIMNVVEHIWKSILTRDTYSCIKGRGIHACAGKLKQDLKNDRENTKYCLKLDIKKYYPSIDHGVLKSILRKKIKDEDLLWLLDEIIDSAAGVPIGNYLSQYFANLYLAYFDHWIKEKKAVKYYYRYADDMVVLSNSKEELHALFEEIRTYLADELKLTVKENYQVFPVEKRGIDFVGYVFFHTHILLRKRIKKRFAKAIAKGKGMDTLVSYMGWAKHCDSKNLLKKLNYAN